GRAHLIAQTNEGGSPPGGVKLCQMATVPCGWMRPEEPVSAASRSCLTSCEKLRIAPRATSCVFANACVWGVGPRFPAPSVEFFDLEARAVDAFEAAHV